ncbi:hypothetical protein BIV59_07260 [Bacillus sp. MUM 13]|nr:hypothetical protein BIV59_07260 [Bacillus sp. MUM 13]
MIIGSQSAGHMHAPFKFRKGSKSISYNFTCIYTINTDFFPCSELKVRPPCHFLFKSFSLKKKEAVPKGPVNRKFWDSLLTFT